MHIFVIIPCYNCSKYLQTAIDSVLSNTTDEIRINVILVDDGSTDDTASLCDQNAQNNERVFAIHKTNGGVSSARNAGIDYVASCFPDSISNGYIAFLDADDAWKDHFFDNKTVELLRTNYDLVGFNSCNCNQKMTWMSNTVRLNEGLYHGGAASVWSHSSQHFGAMLYRFGFVELYHIRFGEGLRHSEDTLFRLQCMWLAKSFFLKNRLLYLYRTNRDSVSHHRLFGIPYFGPIINAYFALDNDMNACLKEEKCVFGRQCAKVYLMDMIDEHYQCFRSGREIDEFLKTNPEYVRLLSGENEDVGGAEPRFLSMCRAPRAYRLKNYFKGIGYTLFRTIRRSKLVWMCYDAYKYRIKI